MKLIGNLSITLLVLVSSLGCSQVRDWVSKPGPNQAAGAPRPVVTKLAGQSQMITGQVVLVNSGYRFRPNEEPEALFRLTRATRSNELTNLEIGLRKYYGKTLVVRGKRQDEWLWEASVIGQFLRPGESAGPVTTAPPEPKP